MNGDTTPPVHSDIYLIKTEIGSDTDQWHIIHFTLMFFTARVYVHLDISYLMQTQEYLVRHLSGKMYVYHTIACIYFVELL